MNKLQKEALDFHSKAPKGKIAIKLPKKLINNHDLSLAYSPGVAEPCKAINKDFNKIYDYTSKGNFVAVISNGTAVLGLGNLGAAASKPVMEGKSALFKRFADIDSIDLEVDEADPKKFIDIVKKIAVTWGGINLEDIKAPECFIIEEELQKSLDIPIFHDDQHGTAIVTVAGLINAAHITKRKIENLNIVVNGAGAAAIACINLIKTLGVKKKNIITCDTKGVIFKGRKEGMNKWKKNLAIETKLRTLQDALVGADVFIGVSVKGVVTKDMVRNMADKPIIFAMANPDPEITPKEVHEVRKDAIVATGRSDYKNQINNFICFPYLFRGVLDVKATTINSEIKIAVAYALAKLARKGVTEEVYKSCIGKNCQFGPEYIIPIAFDLRLMEEVPIATAKAAIDSGVARKKIIDFKAYRRQLSRRLNPSAKIMDKLFATLNKRPKKLIFAEGEEEKVIKAASDWNHFGYGTSILIGREDVIKLKFKELNISSSGINIINPALSNKTKHFANHFYQRHQRRGYIYRDCMQTINRDSNIFASEILINNTADALITGLTSNYLKTLEEIKQVIDIKKGHSLFALSIVSVNDINIFIADTNINKNPSSVTLADIAIQSAEEVTKLGIIPRVAFISSSYFGSVNSPETKKLSDVVKILDEKHVQFEYEGELSIELALDPTKHDHYIFSRLQKPANILIIPSVDSVDIIVKLLAQFAHAKIIGPILYGFNKAVQIVPMNSSSTDILNFAAIATK